MKYINNILYILSITISVLVFTMCKDEIGLMSNENEPSYTIYVTKPVVSSTRATYDDRGDKIAVKWENGDVLTLTTNNVSYRFYYRQSYGDVGAFVHYGDFPMMTNGSEKKFHNDAVLTFSNFTEGVDSNIQTQRKNNECREYLKASLKNVRVADMSLENPISLSPENRGLIHIQAKSPDNISGQSMLKVKGLDKEYDIILGDDADLEFVKEGEILDVYIVVPSNFEIGVGRALKFYLYSYDKDYESAIDGDEYHYYMVCSGSSIKTEETSVVKITLPDSPTHTAIQMGLPSGRKWATTNVGAMSETDYGKYFWWGDVEGKYFNEEYNYQKTVADTWEKIGSVLRSENVLGEDYNFVSDRDAATQNWGDDWKMPNQKDVAELMNRTNCDWTWSSIDGVKGSVVTSKINGKSIFLSAAGYRDGKNKSGQEDKGYYLSSSMSVRGNQKAYCFQLSNDNNLGKAKEDINRYWGMPVRPVLANYSAPGTNPEIEGALSGVFTINSNGKKVRFSKGNLQYRASDKTWRFAENQYDVVGKEGNEKISSSYNGWIDLFCWGTSGWDSGAKNYQPYSTSAESDGYWPGNDPNVFLSGKYAKADWGYNAISNGGNKEGQWRTLRQSEMNYILSSRPNANTLRTKAIVNGVYGAILLPDDWYNQYGINYTGNKTNPSDFSANIYSLEEWKILENSGAVFLPAGGYRKNVDGVNSVLQTGPDVTIGDYWTSSPISKASGSDKLGARAEAGNLSFGTDRNGIKCDGGWYRYTGHSVRVVCDVK